MNEIIKCPKCNGQLEKGVIQFSLRDVMFWGESDVEEKLLSQRWTIHDFACWRCKKCQLAVFIYGKDGIVKP